MYGLTGYPLCHSFSEKYFSEKFERENIGECYRLFPLTDLQSLDVLLTKNADLRGLNVTIPYKKDIIKYLDALSVDAERIGAVNVVKIHRNPDLSIYAKMIKDDRAEGGQYRYLETFPMEWY